ncbi:GNAT family N-acetyltransferase [Clostridium rectalis]|uniref:GNAT family N-acetyltransferase n=1 Tax=Clostridium rectalis TaxID=2040295 RepID=UPI000F638030|nr:GNAT family N-acetyltransferase [Clostridium rectalis]
MEFILKRFDELSNLELYNIIKERVNVFIVEQNCCYEELDDKDLLSIHLFRKDEFNNIIAYLRIIPISEQDKHTYIGRVLVKKEYRNKGIFLSMMKAAQEFIFKELGEKEINLSAQNYLRNGYEKLGFKAISNVYLEDDIPHIKMVKSLRL